MSKNEYLNKKIKMDGKKNMKKNGKKKYNIIKEKGKENKKSKSNKESEKNNIILGKIKIEKNKLKQRIINSYEKFKEEIIDLWGIENEKEIKECEIFINDKKINFNYYYEFENEGYYTINISSKNY